MPEATLATLKTEEQAAGMRPFVYVAGFVGVQLTVLVLILLLSATPWFLTHNAEPGFYQTGYEMRLQHADCDVLLYGDSSSLTGLDPQIIQKLTGLKSCNIAEGTPVQDVVGSQFPLDWYLQRNKRPRYLLMLYTPVIYRPFIEPYTEYFPEGVLFAAQYDRSRDMMVGLSRRAEWLIEYDLWAGRMMLLDALGRIFPRKDGKAVPDTRAERAAHAGYWPYPLPPETRCVRTDRHLDPKNIGRYAHAVAKMRDLYNTGGTTVLIDIAPVPECDTLKDVYRAQAAGLHDNPFEVLPISDFNEGDVHFSPAGAAHISTEAAGQILALERQKPALEAAR